LDLYQEPYDPKKPVICFDEKPVQLIEDVVAPIEMKCGDVKKEDYQYKRNGTCVIFIAFEPLRGWRHIEVRERKRKEDYAQFMKEILERYRDVEVIRLVQDNLNTHKYGSFYESFPAEEAGELRRKFEFHYTPKHASWLNMVEIELAALSKQCLDRRIGDIALLRKEIRVWEDERNRKRVKVRWSFTTRDAREKLERHYIVKN